MTLIHLVQFKFKPEVGESAIRDVCNGFISLKDTCIHAASQKPYIKSVTGGRDNSPEGLQNGFTHAFVVEFESEEDRDYYVKTDEAHSAFAAILRSLAAGLQVVDFTPGKY